MNNYCIILAGGIGKRLWPVSTTERPKQFLDFFGTGRSLLQMTFDRFSQVIPADHIYISTCDEYAPLVREQLPEVPEAHIVCESTRLGTAPAAAAASQLIAQRDADACIVATPADQHIVNEATFLADVESALQRLRVTAVDCFLSLAVQATHPYTSYGYIQKGEQMGSGLYMVKTFTEKPALEFAQMFVESDEFLWNTGLFLWHVNTMERIASDLMEEVQVAQLDGLLLDKHRGEVLVQECNFGWTDVGCWPRMHAVSRKDVDGNALLGSSRIILEGCADSTIAIDPGTKAIIKGLTGYLVAYHKGRLVIIPNANDAEIKHLQLRMEQ